MKSLTLKDIVTSRSLMQKFIKLAEEKGFKYPDAIFCYTKNETFKDWEVSDFHLDGEYHIPTYTLAEWLRILPQKRPADAPHINLFIENPANACASMAIWLLENGYLK